MLTIEEKPFVYARRVDYEGDCTPEEIPCPHYNTSDDIGEYLISPGVIGRLLKSLLPT